jgi:hypothetical protein
MLSDKTAWTHLTAVDKVILYPFAFGCTAINISHTCFDGALFAALSDLVGRHRARALALSSTDLDDGTRKLLRLCSWYVATPCINHGARNSLKWPLKEYVENPKIMKDMWAIIETCRTCYATLMDYKSLWVASRLVFRDWTFENAYRLWTMLGIESQHCEALVEMQIRYENGSICVAEHCHTDPDIVEKVCNLMSVVFVFRKWTDSRWVTMGDTTRTFLGSLFLGIDGLVAFALARGHSIFFFIELQQADGRNQEVCRQRRYGKFR